MTDVSNRTAPSIAADDAREFSESLGRITEGWWRQMALAFKMGVPESLGLSRREWAQKYHGYLKLPIPDRREAVAELTAEGLNNSEIADALGVSDETVARDQGKRDTTNVEPELTSEGKVQVGELDPQEEATNVDPPLSPEEIAEQERRAAIWRTAEGLQAIISHWSKLENLNTSGLREEVIAVLPESDRNALRRIAHQIGVDI